MKTGNRSEENLFEGTGLGLYSQFTFTDLPSTQPWLCRRLYILSSMFLVNMRHLLRNQSNNDSVLGVFFCYLCVGYSTDVLHYEMSCIYSVLRAILYIECVDCETFIFLVSHGEGVLLNHVMAYTAFVLYTLIGWHACCHFPGFVCMYFNRSCLFASIWRTTRWKAFAGEMTNVLNLSTVERSSWLWT